MTVNRRDAEFAEFNYLSAIVLRSLRLCGLKMKTYYHILGILPRASDEDVRRAWRALALRWHPDRNPRNKAQAQRMFVLVNRAYTVLKTKPQRAAYNRFLLSSSLRRQGSRHCPQPDSGLRRNNNGFLGVMKEILWPFALNAEVRHG